MRSVGTPALPVGPGRPLVSVAGPEPLAGYSLTGLSDWFDPFLPEFVRDTLRCDGTVTLALSATGAVEGLRIYHPEEGLGSIFSRSSDVAEAMRAERPDGAFFCELELAAPSERFELFAVDLAEIPPTGEFSYPVRVATARDLPGVVRSMMEIHGAYDPRGWVGADPAVERCLVIGLEDRIAGVGWVTRAGRRGRLHSVSVLPRYRRLGLGTELLQARLRWLRAAGAESALSEIADTNRASRALAEAAGMRAVATMRCYAPVRHRPGNVPNPA